MNKSKGCFFGSIIGDVLGAPYEFMYPNEITLEKNNEFSSGGIWNIPKGYYTDDTSMMLCLAESLTADGNSPHDQISLYQKWYRNGYNSSTGTCFDIGGQTELALKYYETNKKFIYQNESLGNGALMRIAPVAIYSDRDSLTSIARDSVLTTHNNVDNLDCCIKFTKLLHSVIYKNSGIKEIQALFDTFTFDIDESFGNGRVDHSVYIACKSVLMTECFEDALVYSINQFGNDTDTNACVTGALAGAHYGVNNIPSKWMNNLTDINRLNRIYNDLYKGKMK